MGRKFNIPIFYRSSVISSIKNARRGADSRKQDFSPSILDLGGLRLKVARHFGFCFGVENAIEIAYRALQENPDKRVFLLSEMIHNPHVNADLMQRGVRFLLEPSGKQLIPFDQLNPQDIVIVPAFGTTVELFEELESRNINPRMYNATCPFVEKVWKRAAQLGEAGYTIIIHGKNTHEETRATFSHAKLSGPSLVIRDMQEAQLLARYIRREIAFENFANDFSGRCSAGFEAAQHLNRIGVVNQTTMLATETQSISETLKCTMQEHFGSEELSQHFADTRDTLCYATSENQDSIYSLLDSGGDLALVVGGYNSSNTSHLVELCEERLPTFYIKDADEILDAHSIRHLNMHNKEVCISQDWLPQGKERVDVLLSAGASCPDAIVDQVIFKLTSLFNLEGSLEQALQVFGLHYDAGQGAPLHG